MLIKIFIKDLKEIFRPNIFVLLNSLYCPCLMVPVYMVCYVITQCDSCDHIHHITTVSCSRNTTTDIVELKQSSSVCGNFSMQQLWWFYNFELFSDYFDKLIDATPTHGNLHAYHHLQLWLICTSTTLTMGCVASKLDINDVHPNMFAVNNVDDVSSHFLNISSDLSFTLYKEIKPQELQS